MKKKHKKPVPTTRSNLNKGTRCVIFSFLREAPSEINLLTGASSKGLKVIEVMQLLTSGSRTNFPALQSAVLRLGASTQLFTLLTLCCASVVSVNEFNWVVDAILEISEGMFR